MTWGLKAGSYDRDWLDKFAHKDEATIDHIDVFFNGALVYRTQYVSVDEGRAMLPAPRGERTPIPSDYRSFVRLVHALTIGGDESFDNYYRRAGFTTENTPWPVYSER